MMMMPQRHARRATRALVLTASTLLLAASLTACGDEEDTGPVVVKKKVTEKKEDVAEDTGSAANAEELAYTYDPVNRRDPFKTYFDELVLVEADTANLTELQRLNLDALTLVGVVTGTATPMAMVQDGAGKGYTVKIGTLVGKRFGQVKQIRRDEIVVQEEFRDFTGKRIPVYKSLKLDVEAQQ
jgi:type IV pilus assembly protein PilP